MSGEILRSLLAKHFHGDTRMIAHFEDQAAAVDQNSSLASSTAEATDTLQDATVIVLSANKAFNNERLLRRGAGIRMFDTGTALIIELADSLKWLTDPASLGDYANDAAAAAGGVEVGAYYRNGSAIMFRVV